MTIKMNVALLILLLITTVYGKDEEFKGIFEMELHTRPKASVTEQVQAVMDMIRRKLPDHHHGHLLFNIQVDENLGPHGKDTFKISSPTSVNNSIVTIVGNSGVAASYGFMHYLKYYCNSHISWQTDQIELPKELPSAHVKITSKDRFRYYQNVCTVSYSFTWWDWNKWERHIDWMALNGINLPLAFTGQETIWYRVYRRYNLTDDELAEHFAGPPFLAWGRMGNIRGWGGPLSSSWLEKRLALQHKILKRMRSFGMTPILTAFAGHVPRGLTRVFPLANVTRLDEWSHFNATYSGTYLLDPQDDLFGEIGEAFINEMITEFNGTDHFYNCDTFNENTPPSNSPDYLRSTGEAIYKAMTRADPQAIWVMQAWMLTYDVFWTYEAGKALLTSVPTGKMLVLDLASDTVPVYFKFDSFFGQPFIFCMLHNFGGVKGLYGAAEQVLTNLQDARRYPNITIVGLGLTPEGIDQNYVVYDLMMELGWKEPEEVDLFQWASQYAQRRYGDDDDEGLLEEAWKLLIGSVYNSTTPTRFHGAFIPMMHRPDFTRKSLEWYNTSDVIEAWDLLIQAAEKSLHASFPVHHNPEIHNLSLHSNISLTEAIYNFLEANPNHTKTLNQSFYTEEENYADHVSENNYYSQNNYSENHIFSSNVQRLPSVKTRTNLVDKPTFQYDLVDLTRQVLQIHSNHLIDQLRYTYFLESEILIGFAGRRLIEMLSDLDDLLGTSECFLLGKFLDNAAHWASSDEEKYQFIRNSLNQVSLWGPNGEILDYATKQWSGTIRYYVIPRWELFISHLIGSVKNETTYKQKTFDHDVLFNVEEKFAKDTTRHYPSHPSGDTVKMAISLHEKYRRYFKT